MHPVPLPRRRQPAPASSTHRLSGLSGLSALLVAIVLPLAACSSGPRPAAPDASGAVGVPPLAHRGTESVALGHGGAAYLRSLAQAMPADLAPAQGTAPGCPAPSQAAVDVAQEERTKGGSTAWNDLLNAAPGTLAVYLDRTSVSCGDSLSVHVGGRGGNVRIEVWRMGWYGGSGGRLVQRTGAYRVPRLPAGARVGATRTAFQHWPQTVQLNVTSAWVPGVYLVLARPTAGGPAAWTPLVVREDQSRSGLLVDMSDLSWAAYDTYGGASLYNGPGGTHTQQVATRALAVPLARPADNHDDRQVLVFDLPLVRRVERLGLPVSYTTGTAFDATPSTLLQHAGLVFGGHPEYWTTRMYDAVEAARNAGVNVAFFGANDVYWHARLAPAVTVGTDAARATVVVYRDPTLDPQTTVHPAQATVRWREWPLNRDPSELVGQTTTGVGVSAGFIVNDARSWLLAGTSARPGEVLPAAVGNEADGVRLDLPAAQPAPLDVVLATAYQDTRARSWLISSTYYSTPSGAGVFSAGTTFWLCGLERDCPGQPTPKVTQRLLGTVTDNVLRAFARPRAGKAHPAVAVPALSPQLLLRHLPPQAVGHLAPNAGDEKLLAVLPRRANRPAAAPTSSTGGKRSSSPAATAPRTTARSATAGQPSRPSATPTSTFAGTRTR